MIGCLVVIAVLAALVGEAFSFVAAHRLLGTYARDLIGGGNVSDTILPIILLQVAAMVAGVLLVKGAVGRLPLALMGGLLGQGSQAGRLIIGMAAGILLILPGFFLDVAAVFLLLPPVQSWLAGLGQRIALSLVRRQMGKMFPGGMPGGGMPGGFPGGFPGMLPRGGMSPDARVGRGGRVVDVEAERLDKG